MLEAKFIKSAVLPEDYPDEDRPEVVIVGRSNAGKSSLLNSLCGNKKLAHVSSTPGKTRLLNFFNVAEGYRLVDIPGYGFAARQKTERRLWEKMIVSFLNLRANLKGVVLVADIRRQWEEEESAVLEMCHERGLRFICALNKTDKLSKSDLQKAKNRWFETSGLDSESFCFVSCLNKVGVQELESYIFKTWIKKGDLI